LSNQNLQQQIEKIADYFQKMLNCQVIATQFSKNLILNFQKTPKTK